MSSDKTEQLLQILLMFVIEQGCDDIDHCLGWGYQDEERKGNVDDVCHRCQILAYFSEMRPDVWPGEC